ncbi:MAG: family channel protein [Mycobacterium sp.]|nr:family channel protein [Mycobacterium sp.]
MREPTMMHRLAAEFIGTFWLVFGGCGAAVFAANPTEGSSVGIGFLGVALAFGLAVLTGVYAFGTISGGHFKPRGDAGRGAGPPGGVEGGARLLDHPGDRGRRRRHGDLRDRQGQGGLDRDRTHGCQRIWRTLSRRVRVVGGDHRRGGPHRDLPAGHPGLNRRPRTKRVRGLRDWPDLDADPPDLDPDHTSVNPARSTGVAFFNGDGAPAQLWVFWLAPLLGAAIAGVAYPYLFGRNEELADRPVRDDALEDTATT